MRREKEKQGERGEKGGFCATPFFFLEIQLAKRRYVSPYRYFIPYRLSPEISCSLEAQVTLFFRSHGGHPSLSPFVSRTVNTVADAVETSDGLHSGLRNDDPDLLNQISDL